MVGNRRWGRHPQLLSLKDDMRLRFLLLFYLLFQCRILGVVRSTAKVLVLHLSFASNISMQHGRREPLLLNRQSIDEIFQTQRQHQLSFRCRIIPLGIN